MEFRRVHTVPLPQVFTSASGPSNVGATAQTLMGPVLKVMLAGAVQFYFGQPTPLSGSVDASW
jgi:hypothetical protein